MSARGTDEQPGRRDSAATPGSRASSASSDAKRSRPVNAGDGRDTVLPEGVSSTATTAKGRRPARSTIAWSLPYPILLALLAIWGALGLVEGEAAELALPMGSSIALLLAGWFVTLQRERVSPKRWINATCLAIACVCATAALEICWCRGKLVTEPRFLAMELAMAALVIGTLYFASQRRGAGSVAGVAAFVVIGMAQYFVRVHKGTAILPSDLLGAATAAAVAGGYVYTLDGTSILGIAISAIGCCACSFIRPYATTDAKSHGERKELFGRHQDVDSEGGMADVTGVADAASNAIPKVSEDPQALLATSSRTSAAWRCLALNFVCALACIGVLYLGVTCVDYSDLLGVRVDGWDTATSYEKYGLLTSFVSACQDLKITKPAGYSKTAAEADEAELAQEYRDAQDENSRTAAQEQYETLRPSIVCVMNETFSDMSLYDELGVGYEGPEFFNSIDDALVRGRLAVSAYAGGTCNSEFEFLTGNTLGYLGAGAYPYTLYDLSSCDNLAAQLAAQGYETTAIHPNLGTNWNREGIYANFGFQTFYTIDDFEDAEQFHSGVSDKATYERVLEQLSSSDEPQFVFDVTMQNHSSYDQGNIDESLLRGYSPEYLTDEQSAELNEYLACIDASDADLEWFIGELEKLDRPVVLVFFGDHQASVSAAVNDALFPNEGDQTHAARTYVTSYLVWANYEVVGAGEMRTESASSSTLAALALDACGAPLSSYQQATLGARINMPMIDALYYTDTDERIHATGALKTTAGADPNGDSAARARDSYLKLARVQYLNFATLVQ